MIYLVTLGVLLFPLSFPGIPTFLSKKIKPIFALIIPFFIFFVLVILATWISYPINNRFWTIPMQVVSYLAIVYTGISLPLSIKFWIRNKNILFYIFIIILLLFISRYFWHTSLVYNDALLYTIIEHESYLGQKLLSSDFTNYYKFAGIYQFIGIFSSILHWSVLDMHVIFSLIVITMMITIFIVYVMEEIEIKINKYAIYIFVLLFIFSPSELIIWIGTSFTLFFFFGPLFFLLLLKKNYSNTDGWLYILIMALACTFTASFISYIVFFFFLAIKIQFNIMTIFLSIITLQFGMIISWEYALFSLIVILYPTLIRTTLISEAVKMINVEISGKIFAILMSFLLILILTIFLIIFNKYTNHLLFPNHHDVWGWMTSIFGFGLQYFNFNSYLIVVLFCPIILYMLFRNKKVDLLFCLFILLSFIVGYSFYIQIIYSGLGDINAFTSRLYYSLPLSQQQIVICLLVTFLIMKIKLIPKLISGYRYLIPLTPLILLAPAFSVNVHYIDKNDKAQNEIASAITKNTLFITHNEELLLTVFDSNSTAPRFYSRNILNSYDFLFYTQSDPNSRQKWKTVLDKTVTAINFYKNYDDSVAKESIIPGVMAYYSTDMYIELPEYQKSFRDFIDKNVDFIILDNNNKSKDVVKLVNFKETPLVSNQLGAVYGK